MGEGIAASKVHPKYLQSNSTSHPWAFGAFAELIDNSYDAKAREVQIDQMILQDKTCLSFLDDGSGMDKDHLYKMLSFGFCDRVLSTAIGKYGNGFKSSSMRLGKDALVFTRTKDTAEVGFLSQTYNQAITADSVRVPMLHYRMQNLMYEPDDGNHMENLTAIMDHSPFEEEEMLIKQLRQLPKTGTRIIIYNLKENETHLELNFDADLEDIRCGDAPQAHAQNRLTYRNSLREYCSILYLHPRMKIKLRGINVKTKLVAKSLCDAKSDVYTPKQVQRNVNITFGFVPESERSEDCGMMLYSDNRLIKPYEQVSCQKQGKGVGAYVVGVTQAKFLTPTQNKQDFNRDSKYITAVAAFNVKLKNYWETMQASSSKQKRKCLDINWVQCSFKNCLKWRHLPQGTNMAELPDRWFCLLHPNKIDCSFPEDTHEDIMQAPVRTSVKRKPNAILSETDSRHSKRKNTSVPIYTFSDEFDNHEETPNTSDSNHSSDLNLPSTSSARKPSLGKSPAKSRPQISKIAPRSSRKKIDAISDDQGAGKTIASTKIKRNSHRQSSLKRYFSADTSVDIGQGEDDNTDTSVDIGQGGDDNSEISIDIQQRSDDTTETLIDITNEGNGNSEASFDIGHSHAKIDLIDLKDKEIAELKHNLTELTDRFHALLDNSKKLLSILAPDVSLTDDVDVEQLIALMIETGLDE